MALKLYERYPQLWESPSNDYPQGAFKNLSAQGETDGSYLEKDWLNDYSGFFGALLRNAEMTPDGTIDTAQRSQFYDALIKVAKESVSEEGYRKLDDNVFNGLMTIKSDNDEQGVGILLQESDGTVRGSLVSNSNGIQITQVIGEGSEQSFTFPSEGNSGELALTSYVDAQIESIPESDSIPVGMVQAFIGEAAPNDKWLLCRGQAFSAESYPDLAQLLPDLKIPDLRGVALRGLDANRGFDPERALLSYQEDAIRNITGTVFTLTSLFNGSSILEHSRANGAFKGESLINADSTFTVTNNSASNAYPRSISMDASKVVPTASENRMKNIAVNFIIKAG